MCEDCMILCRAEVSCVKTVLLCEDCMLLGRVEGSCVKTVCYCAGLKDHV